MLTTIGLAAVRHLRANVGSSLYRSANGVVTSRAALRSFASTALRFEPVKAPAQSKAAAPAAGKTKAASPATGEKTARAKATKATPVTRKKRVPTDAQKQRLAEKKAKEKANLEAKRQKLVERKAKEKAKLEAKKQRLAETKAKVKAKLEAQKKLLAEKKLKPPAKRELVAKSLVKVEPKPRIVSPWTVYIAQQTKGDTSEHVLGRAAELAPKYKALSAVDRKALEDEAGQTRIASVANYKAWVESHTIGEIKEANAARRKLNKLYKNPDDETDAISLIHDSRVPKRPKNAYLLFTQSRREELLGQGVSGTDAVAQLARDWNALNQSGRQPYDALAKLDLERYHIEMKALGLKVRETSP